MSAADAVIWWLLGTLAVLLTIAGLSLALERMLFRFDAEDAGREE